MARVLYGQGVAGFKGSISGTCFSSNASGSIAYAKPFPRKSFFPVRYNNLVNLSYFNSAWFALEPVEREYWNAYAREHYFIDSYGSIKRINGKSYFTHLNYHRLKMGYEILTDPPSYIIPPDMPIVFPIIQDGEWFLNSYADPYLENHKIFIFATPPLPRSTLYFKNKFRLLVIVNGFNGLKFYIQELLSEYFGFNFPITSDPPDHTFTIATFLYYVNIHTGHNGKGFLAYYGMP